MHKKYRHENRGNTWNFKLAVNDVIPTQKASRAFEFRGLAVTKQIKLRSPWLMKVASVTSHDLTPKNILVKKRRKTL